jgi:hypothetical protein
LNPRIVVRFHAPEPGTDVEKLLEAGYVVFPTLLGPELSAEVERPLLEGFAGATVGADGWVVRDALDVCPAASRAVLHPAVVTLARAVLGDDVRLEALAAIVSDRRRPFMPWHSHVGGVEQERVRREGEARPVRPRRLMILAYPSGCEPGFGPLLVLPRRFADPIAPPFAPSDPNWAGAHELRAPPGTVVVGDEALLHAVLPQTDARPRCIVGGYVTRAEEIAKTGREPSVARFRTDDPALRPLFAP